MTGHLQEILADFARLEPFPRAAIRVLELSLGDAEIEQVAAVAEQDPGLCSKILKLTASVQYAGVQEINSVREAIVRLGQKTVASIAMTSGCASYFMGYGGSTPRSNSSLWEECVHVAVTARQIATRTGTVDRELAYTVGLLQNTGHIVLDRFLELHRDKILARVEDGMDMLQAERAVLGLDHAQFGARVALKWGFPGCLTRGIKFHHAPSEAGGFQELCSIVNLAEHLTSASLANHGTSMLYSCVEANEALQRFDADEVSELMSSVQGELLDSELAAA